MKKHLEEKQKDALAYILEQSDLVKFAKYIPNEKTIDDLKKQSELFIQQTKIILKEENNDPQEDENVLVEEESVQNNLQEEKGD